MSERVSTFSVRGALLFLHIVLISLIFTFTGTARCQGVKRVILIESMPVPVVLSYSQSFAKQLKSLYQDGGVEIKVLRAFGKQEEAEHLLTAELATAIPDLVVPIATVASKAACKVLKGTSIPIFFFVCLIRLKPVWSII